MVSAEGIEPSLVRQQAVNLDRAASADVNPSVGDGGDGELDRVTSLVAAVGRLRTVPKVGGQVAGIVGMQHRWAETVGTRNAELCGINRPDDAVRRSLRRDRGHGSPTAVGRSGLRGGSRVELSASGIEGEGAQFVGCAREIEFILPERRSAKDGIGGTEALYDVRISGRGRT